jgi:hypothetical protein
VLAAYSVKDQALDIIVHILLKKPEGMRMKELLSEIDGHAMTAPMRKTFGVNPLQQRTYTGRLLKAARVKGLVNKTGKIQDSTWIAVWGDMIPDNQRFKIENGEIVESELAAMDTLRNVVSIAMGRKPKPATAPKRAGQKPRPGKPPRRS